MGRGRAGSATCHVWDGRDHNPSEWVVTEDEDDGASMSPGEVSPCNRNAVRGDDGIWNRDSLPVRDWERSDQRVVIPDGLWTSIGGSTPAVLRWSDVKYRAVIVKHERDLPVIRDLSRHLANWTCHGEEKGRAGHQRVVFQDDHGRWYAVTIGTDRHCSYDIVTLTGGSDRGFVENRKRGMVNIVHMRT